MWIALLTGSIASGEPAGNVLAQADAALQAGEADRAMMLLSSAPASSESHNIKCRVQFALEHWDAAVSECEQAVNMDGRSSSNHLWLGRALGEKADRASFVTAYSLGKRARVEFEQAVQLDARNAEAIADLGEFYSSAPGIVGGGTDKANALVPMMDKIDAARGLNLRGRIAESVKDYGTAERQYKAAVAVSQHPAFEWMTLASFYRRRSRYDDLQDAVENGIRAAQKDRRAGVALFNGASALTRANRQPEVAAKMLEDYLNAPVKTEEAPAFVAHVKLAKLKAQLGDKNAAWRERSAALALAHDYRPAEELKF